MRSRRMPETPNVSLWRSFLHDPITRSIPHPVSLYFAGEQRAQILFRGSPVAGLVCLAVIVTPSCLVGHSRGLKGTKLDHRDTRREHYPQHKWLSAGLIDKLPLHFISQTDRA